METTSPRQPGVGFIFVTLVLAVVGFGLLIPVLPGLIVQLEGGQMTTGSHYYGLIMGGYAFMQFICAPILGSLSDRYGRRRIILIATAGSACDYFIMANAPTLAWFFVARLIAGSTAGVLSTANAYIADVTPPEKRAHSFGLLGAAFGIGFTIGPVLGGFLGQYDIRLPFYVAGCCSAANWIYGYFALPESLKPEHRREFSWRRANPVGALLTLKRLPAVFGLAETFFIMSLGQSMLQVTWALYCERRYNWGPRSIGISFLVLGVMVGVVQSTVVKRVVPRIGEARAVLTGMSISVLAFIGYGLARHGWMLYAVMIYGVFAGIAGPALQAYITKHVPPNEQGSVQGVYSGLQSLASIPGPLLGGWSFGWAVEAGRAEWLVGTPFFIGAALTFLALALAAQTFRRDRQREAARLAAG
ncbi:MAG TPA: TCR/Tet family MFS transporter [Lacunisphaera sp.]|jgi:DHA1 family tetracycline resistance protein-like MFS transporter|nr:TCR/Tet family MFS transporter [Lacunisphaera sp.]